MSAAMSYGLAPHIHVAIFDDRVIVLDERRDRYFMLSAPAGRILASLFGVGGAIDVACPEPLLKAGVVVAGSGRRLMPALPAVTHSVRDEGGSRPAALSTLSVLAPLACAMLRLRFGGIGGALADARARRGRSRSLSPDRAAATALAHAFERARERIPVKRVCLRDSLAFHALACRRGIEVSLVVGVRLNPFAAHSWVQIGSTCLTDDLDTVVGFRPILSL